MMKNTAKRHVFLRFDFTQAALNKCNKTHKTESRNLKATFFSSVLQNQHVLRKNVEKPLAPARTPF
jgi:hypothetical protein